MKYKKNINSFKCSWKLTNFNRLIRQDRLPTTTLEIHKSRKKMETSIRQKKISVHLNALRS